MGGEILGYNTLFQPAFYITKSFYSWWAEFYTTNMFNTTQISKCLTKAFLFVQENIQKGKFTHIKEIQAFQRYFETVYDPTNISRTVFDAAKKLKEKFTKKLPSLKIPSSIKREHRYELVVQLQPPKFPKLPNADFGLAFFLTYPNWFNCGNIFNTLKNDAQTPSKRVVLTKHTLDSFKGHIHYDLSVVSIVSDTYEGVEPKDSLILSIILSNSLNIVHLTNFKCMSIVSCQEKNSQERKTQNEGKFDFQSKYYHNCQRAFFCTGQISRKTKIEES